MRNLKDIIIERLRISKNLSSQDISWEEFCKALVNYLPRKNAKNNTIFVKNTDITEDIYIKDKLIYSIGNPKTVEGAKLCNKQFYNKKIEETFYGKYISK